MSQPLKLEFHISPTGQGRVIVDGREISKHVTALEVDSAVDTATTVKLTLTNVDVAVLKADDAP